MRLRVASFVIAAIVVAATLLLSPARASDKPYDPYPWCAVYGGDMSGASNCGFLTLQQCRATVSGIGGSCEPNQFYNPGRPAARTRKHKPN